MNAISTLCTPLVSKTQRDTFGKDPTFGALRPTREIPISRTISWYIISVLSSIEHLSISIHSWKLGAAMLMRMAQIACKRMLCYPFSIPECMLAPWNSPSPRLSGSNLQMNSLLITIWHWMRPLETFTEHNVVEINTNFSGDLVFRVSDSQNSQHLRSATMIEKFWDAGNVNEQKIW